MKVWVRAAGVAVGVVLALSLWANWQLYQQSMANYRELNLVRLDPLGSAVFGGAGELARGEGEKLVVLLGDSRAAEWTVNSDEFITANPGEATAEEVFVLEGLPGHLFVNRGIGAQTTAQVRGRLGEDVGPLRPEVLVVQVGINDLKTLPLFPARAEEISGQVVAQLRGIVEDARGAGVQRVVLTTIFPIGDVPLEQQLVWTPQVVAGVEEVNAAIRALAGGPVVVIDPWPQLVDGRGVLREEYRRDALHLNAEGYAVLNDHLRRVLGE